MPVWLSKPLYELLPYFYILAGALLTALSRQLEGGRWRSACLALGLGCLIAGAALWWRRRRFRRSR